MSTTTAEHRRRVRRAPLVVLAVVLSGVVGSVGAASALSHRSNDAPDGGRHVRSETPQTNLSSGAAGGHLTFR